jgi:cytochrome c-type biogenesis protein
VTIIVAAFFAGILTALAPCILPLLPIVIGGSIDGSRSLKKPLTIVGSLAVSVIVFTLLLKASTSLLGVPVEVWQWLSGGMVILLGLLILAPKIWEWLALKTGVSKLGSIKVRTGSTANDVLTGASLGPIFNSCSPTYLFIVGIILPGSFAQGFAAITAYALGLALILLIIAVGGRNVVQRLGWAANPHGTFRKVLGVLFIIVGLSVILGVDKDLQTYILDKGWYAPISNIEMKLE